MKDYEKAALAVGAGALGLAAYQAWKSKQAADATTATDPSRNPIQTAVDLSRNMIGGTVDWFKQVFDRSTGYTKGRAENVVNTMKAAAYSPLYLIEKTGDFGRDAVEAGSKYLWSFMAQKGADTKTKIEQLTNKPFTLMGATVTTAQKRYIPTITSAIGDIVTGVGSKLEETTHKARTGIGGIKDRIFSVFGR